MITNKKEYVEQYCQNIVDFIGIQSQYINKTFLCICCSSYKYKRSIYSFIFFFSFTVTSSFPDWDTVPKATGYSASADGGVTTYGGTATVICDTGNGYSGSPSALNCQEDGTWIALSVAPKQVYK